MVPLREALVAWEAVLEVWEEGEGPSPGEGGARSQVPCLGEEGARSQGEVAARGEGPCLQGGEILCLGEGEEEEGPCLVEREGAWGARAGGGSRGAREGGVAWSQVAARGEGGEIHHLEQLEEGAQGR